MCRWQTCFTCFQPLVITVFSETLVFKSSNISVLDRPVASNRLVSSTASALGKLVLRLECGFLVIEKEVFSELTLKERQEESNIFHKT